MISYLPWSQTVWNDVIQSFRSGQLPILDIEMGAICKHRIRNHGCIYCDSQTGKPQPGELTFDQTKEVIVEAVDVGLKWIYCCGLGEPTDDKKFNKMVEFCAPKGIYTSIFTNAIDYDNAYLQYLYDNNVCIIVKCDSFKVGTFGKLLGTSNLKDVDAIYASINNALRVGFANHTNTRIGLSIVPTKVNKNDILDVVKYCNDNNIFPVIGELEYVGRGKELFDSLALSQLELQEIKNGINEILGCEYVSPVCPASIAGIHITNVGDCIVHEKTGLSCPWFDLKEPRIEFVGNVKSTSISDLWQLVQKYRSDRMVTTKEWLRTEPNNYVFGGCGGNDLVLKYSELYGWNEVERN